MRLVNILYFGVVAAVMMPIAEVPAQIYAEGQNLVIAQKHSEGRSDVKAETEDGAVLFRPGPDKICYTTCNGDCETLKDTPIEYKKCLLLCMAECERGCKGSSEFSSSARMGPGGERDGKPPKGLCTKASKMCQDPKRDPKTYCDILSECSAVE